MRSLKLSKRASKKIEKLIQYLEKEWSTKTKTDFIDKLDGKLQQIQKFPESCPQSTHIKGLYRLIVTKQTSLYYRYNTKTITIVTLIDNRMRQK